MVTYDDIEARQAGWLAWQAGLKNRSFLLDLKILFMTFFNVLRREGVTH
jgi:lipopolysaccharide/colanic/teichoic acid biosynthesis glycosyltransferase